MIEEKPINVPSSATPAQLWAAFRYLVAALGAYAVGKGYIKDDTLELISLLITTGVPLAYGVWETYHNQQKLFNVVTSEDTVVPTAVAKVS